ncbi:MAG: sensor domain-containing diguanylate cyclase [Myxococcota bacterium]|nr:sensor domain-containing diguanylate cyclase [Myxococcota bacterium]
MGKKQFEEHLLWLLRVSRGFFTKREMQPLLEEILEAFIDLSGYPEAYVFLLDRNTEELVFRYGQQNDGETLKFSDAKKIAPLRRVMKKGLCQYSDPDTKKGPANIAIPLMSETESQGIVYLNAPGSGKLQPINNHLQRAFEILAENAGASIENVRMFERATNDPLTGLPNSSYFLIHLAKIMREANEDSVAGILLLDMDHFKRINHAAGAEVGDKALIDVGETLQDIARADGLVARYGSDKFAILLPPEDETPIGIRVRDVAERARAAVAAKSYHGINLSASIGGLTYPGKQNVESAPDLIAWADDVLSRARAKGPGGVEIEST